MPHAARQRLVWTGYFGLTLIGVYVAALGPGLPGIAKRAHMPLSQAGTVFTAIFAGGLVMSIIAGRAMDRFGRQPLLVVGSLVDGSGLLLLSFAGSWPQVLASGLVIGLGDSILVVGYHVIFADLHPGEGGAALNRLNVFFGVGALIGPALAGLSILAIGDIRLTLWLTAAAEALAALILATSTFPGAPATARHAVSTGFALLLRRRLVWALVVLLLLYVGLEVGMGNWAYTYLRRFGGFGVTAASLVTSGYWLMLTLGRALSPYLLRRWTEPTFLAIAALATCATASLLVLMAGWSPGAAVCILLLGLAFGPVWPLAFAVATRAFPDGAGTVSGLLAATSSIGGIVWPWLQGNMLLEHGSYAGMALTCAGCAGLVICSLAALRPARCMFEAPAGPGLPRGEEAPA